MVLDLFAKKKTRRLATQKEKNSARTQPQPLNGSRVGNWVFIRVKSSNIHILQRTNVQRKVVPLRENVFFLFIRSSTDIARKHAT